MLFPTLSFAVFFVIVLPVSWLLMPDRVRWRLFLIGASWFFYGCADWRFVPLLAGSTVVNHVFARQIDRADGRTRSAWTAAAVVVNLAVLGWFKYIGFFTLSAQSVLNFLGLSWRLPLPDVVLPIGISFFTFQALSYVIDTARRKIRPVSFLDFAVYLSFFPHLVAGPIVRASEFLPQIKRRIDPRKVDVSRAFWLIAVGLFKKVVIASYLSQHAADPLFGFPHQHAGIEALFGVYAYAIQIYADFSGYTDIAIGLALLLGVNFPQNFNVPYAATSLQDFWRRWHMTLSRWLRDYLYIPLGGNRNGRWRTYVNVMVTMLLGGLWHGAAWTFVVWGGLLGTGLAVERWLGERRSAKAGGATPALAAGTEEPTGNGKAALTEGPASAGLAALARVGKGRDAGGHEAVGVEAVRDQTVVGEAAVAGSADGMSPLRSWMGRLITFHVVCLSWIFFRATSFHNAVDVLGRIFTIGGRHAHLHFWVVMTVVGALAVQVGPRGWGQRAQAQFSRWPLWGQSLSLATVLIAVDIMGPTGVAPFIYFRF
jgi:D-alanyl-lipoteichoic acid acyltransferase DltB (MBOAT superfamily)